MPGFLQPREKQQFNHSPPLMQAPRPICRLRTRKNRTKRSLWIDVSGSLCNQKRGIQWPRATIKCLNRENRKMTSEKALVVILRCTAGLLLLALAPVLFPHSWMAAINREIGLGELPDTAIVGYLTRSLSALYAYHGALVLYLSLDVRRYLPLIGCLAVVNMMFGAMMLSLDIYLGMPLPWTIGEGPLIFGLGAVIFGLAARVKRKNLSAKSSRDSPSKLK
jgi:hypothetical protein